MRVPRRSLNHVACAVVCACVYLKSSSSHPLLTCLIRSTSNLIPPSTLTPMLSRFLVSASPTCPTRAPAATLACSITCRVSRGMSRGVSPEQPPWLAPSPTYGSPRASPPSGVSRVVFLDHLCAIRREQALHLTIKPRAQPCSRLSPRRHRHQGVAPHHPGVKLPIRPPNPGRSGGSTRGGRGGGSVDDSRRNRRIRCGGADRGNRVCLCLCV